MAINSSTARADIFKEFRAVINDNIANNVKVTNAFVNDVAVLPQIVINPVVLPRARFKLGVEAEAYNRDGSVDIEVFASKNQTLVELADEVDMIIHTNLSTLGVQNISVGSSTSASLEVGGKQVHTMTIPISFMYRG